MSSSPSVLDSSSDPAIPTTSLFVRAPSRRSRAPIDRARSESERVMAVALRSEPERVTAVALAAIGRLLIGPRVPVGAIRLLLRTWGGIGV